VRAVTNAELDVWIGGSNHNHRRKIMVVIDALQRYGDSVAFVDCDAYFLKAPGSLFDFDKAWQILSSYCGRKT
jgi:hypothetical protein